MSRDIILREVKNNDLPIFFKHQQDEEALHMAAFVSKDPSDRLQFNRHWEKIMADKTTINRTILYQGEVVGHLAKFVMFGNDEITYWIDKNYWGKGIATEALQQFLQDTFPTRPVYARAASDNIGSRRVLEKCGFVLEGYDHGFANARNAEIEEAIYILE